MGLFALALRSNRIKPNDSNGSVGLRYRFSQDAEGYTQPTTITTTITVVLVYIHNCLINNYFEVFGRERKSLSISAAASIFFPDFK